MKPSRTLNKLSKTIIGLLAVSVGVSSFSRAADSNDFEAKWQLADEKRQAAAAVHYEWRDTASLLEQAREAQKSGDLESANTLVDQALEQSNDALAQAEREKGLWQARVPK